MPFIYRRVFAVLWLEIGIVYVVQERFLIVVLHFHFLGLFLIITCTSSVELD